MILSSSNSLWTSRMLKFARRSAAHDDSDYRRVVITAGRIFADEARYPLLGICGPAKYGHLVIGNVVVGSLRAD